MHVLCFFWQDPETYQWYVQASADYFQVTFEEAESMVGRAPPNPMQRALNIDSRGFLPKRLGEFLMEKNWGNFFWGLEVVGCFFCYYFDLSVQICSFFLLQFWVLEFESQTHIFIAAGTLNMNLTS